MKTEKLIMYNASLSPEFSKIFSTDVHNIVIYFVSTKRVCRWTTSATSNFALISGYG